MFLDQYNLDRPCDFLSSGQPSASEQKYPNTGYSYPHPSPFQLVLLDFGRTKTFAGTDCHSIVELRNTSDWILRSRACIDFGPATWSELSKLDDGYDDGCLVDVIYRP